MQVCLSKGQLTKFILQYVSIFAVGTWEDDNLTFVALCTGYEFEHNCMISFYVWFACYFHTNTKRNSPTGHFHYYREFYLFSQNDRQCCAQRYCTPSSPESRSKNRNHCTNIMNFVCVATLNQRDPPRQLQCVIGRYYCSLLASTAT